MIQGQYVSCSFCQGLGNWIQVQRYSKVELSDFEYKDNNNKVIIIKQQKKIYGIRGQLTKKQL